MIDRRPDAPAVAVNGRFQSRPVTGVERYARELLAHLPAALGEAPTVLAPPGPAQGVRGHAWEQLALPRTFRRSGAQVLLSPCNFGPVAVRRQLVVIHDVAPLLFPSSFGRGYRRQVRMVQPLLARRTALATVSEASRRDLARMLGRPRASIGLVPPAVGPPFAPGPAVPALDGCLLVGAHDERKNAGFLLDLWPEVHRRTGLQLHVTARSGGGSLRRQARAALQGVTWHLDVDDQALRDLYRSARWVVSPSRYEGFGLPLLEGMSCGAPFLSTDTGAARELAVDPHQQLLPLEPRAWVEQMVAWAEQDPRRLGEASLARAAGWTWQASAVAAARLLAGLVTAEVPSGRGAT